MLRNLIALLFVFTIIFNKYKLNFIECIIFNFICIAFIIGNFGFYFLQWYPQNTFWNFIIKGGHYWYEMPVTIFTMLTLLIYKLFTCK
jgi:hypothetical protein